MSYIVGPKYVYKDDGTQPAILCSKLIIETLVQVVKFVQSWEKTPERWSSVSIVTFEQANADWIIFRKVVNIQETLVKNKESDIYQQINKLIQSYISFDGRKSTRSNKPVRVNANYLATFPSCIFIISLQEER